MSYLDATATHLLNIRCLCCGRALLDAASVTIGIGPDCRSNHGFADAREEHRDAANKLIFEGALEETTADRRLEIAEALRGFGMEKLARLVVERFARQASAAARARAEEKVLDKAPAPPAIRIEEVSAPLFRGGPAVVALAVFTPYDAAFVETLKGLIHWQSRGWDGARKAWLVSPAFKWEVLSALSRHFAGQRAVGAKGAFVIPSPSDLPPKGGARAPVSAEALREERRAEQAPSRAAEAASRAEAAGAFPYQVAGAEWLSGMPKALLADDMGLGKTWQLLLGAPAGAALLAVVPACVKYNWADEAARLRPELKVSVLDGRGSWHWPAAGELVIVNYDILPAFLQPAAKGKPADVPAADRAAAAEVLLLVDEAQAVKSTDSLRHKAVRTLAGLCAGAWFATGTPVENRGKDLWGVLSALGVARQVFGSFDAFLPLVGAYKEVIRTRGGSREVIQWPVGAGTVSPEVNRLLRGSVMLRRLKSQVARDLPAKVRRTVRVDGLTPALRAELDAAWAGWDVAARGELPPFERFSLLRARLAQSRIPAMVEFIEQYEEAERPLLVFSAHRGPVDVAGAREGWAKITGDESPEQRRDVVRAFQAGELKGVALTIQAGGVGLTLTHAQDALFVDKAWNPSGNLQAEDRIHRIGQTGESVSYTTLVSNHPLDLHVLALVSAKEATASDLMDGTAEAPRLAAEIRSAAAAYPALLTPEAVRDAAVALARETPAETEMGAVLADAAASLGVAR